MIKAGDYTTKSGKTARIYQDSRGYGALAAVIGVGLVGYDEMGKPVSEDASEDLQIDLRTWRVSQEYGTNKSEPANTASSHDQ